MDVGTNSIKHSLQHDVHAFLQIFSTLDHIRYASFVDNWTKHDLSLLTLVSPPESIIRILLQAGLFTPTRPFRDHQLLVFFLFNLFKACKQPLKLEADRIQLLLGVGMRARTLNETETAEALDVLFKRGAFLILAEEQNVITNTYNVTSSSSTYNTVSVDQLVDRIKRIESFLHSRPLFDQKLSKHSLSRLKTLFERYHESKLKNNLTQEQEDQFGASMGAVMKIVEGYEKLVHRFIGSIPMQSSSASSSKPRSVRSRLTQSSLTPIIPASASADSLPSDFFMTMTHQNARSQSVPASKMSRRSSAFREMDLDEFINENNSTASTNMPNLDFY